jgi:hypothetical protein
VAAGVGGLGVVCGLAGYTIDPRRFAFAYLMGFLTVLTMALGSTFFVLLQHLTGAGWSVTVRRTSEFFVAGAIILPVLALPNLLSLGELYPWWQPSSRAAGSRRHIASKGVPPRGRNRARRLRRRVNTERRAGTQRRPRSARVRPVPSTLCRRPRSRRSSAT